MTEMTTITLDQLRELRLGHRQLGYGQDAGAPTRRLSLVIDVADFVRIVDTPYASYVEDVADDGDCDDEDPLIAAGYPPLARVVEEPRLLQFVATECLHFQLLEELANSRDPRVVVNQVVDAQVGSGLVTLVFEVYDA